MKNLLFLKESLKKFKTQGSLFPSTSALSRAILRPIEMKPGMTIVELGAGTGIFTKEIVHRLREGSKLVVFENNKALAGMLRHELRVSIGDGRVTLIEGDAADLALYLTKLELPLADYVVSGLPIGNFNRSTRQKIFDAIKVGMKDDGTYMQFQYLLASWLHVRKQFDAKIVGYEVRNLPPAFIYMCRKKGNW